MEYTEKERLMLVDLKQDINDLSKKLLQNTNKLENFDSVIFCQTVTEIQSKMSTLSSYSSIKNYDLNKIEIYSAKMMRQAMVMNEYRNKDEILPSGRFLLLKMYVITFVSVVNSIEWDFHKKRFSINLKELKFGDIKLPDL